MVIPAALLRRFYVDASLQAVEHGFQFKLKNTVAPATVIVFGPVEIDGEPVAADQVTITASKPRKASTISTQAPLIFSMGNEISIRVEEHELGAGEHEILVHAQTKEVGAIVIGFAASI